MTKSPMSLTCRAAVFAAVAVGVSGTGHAVMSAHDVPFAGFAFGFAAVFAVAAAVAGKERGYWIIVGWMGWSQLALHLIFALVQGSVDPAAHHGTAVPAEAGAGHGSGPGMLLWHTGTALLSSWWLRRGEAAASALAQYVRTLLFPPLLPAARWRPAPRPAVHSRMPRRVRVPTPVLRHAVVVRGPPPSPALL